MVVDSQKEVLLLASVDSELSLAMSCAFSKFQVCEDVNSEHVVPHDDVIIVVVVVTFLILDDEVVEFMLPSFSLNVPFPM